MGFQKTCEKAPEHFELVSREDAASKGRRRYFTGEPCKHGHVSPRYVSTGACIGCLNKWKHLSAKNPFSKDLVPWDGAGLWRSKRLDTEQLAQLNTYMQECINTFCAHVLPPLCSTCDGQRYVPAGNGRNDWVLCAACATPEPSTDTVPSGTTP